jgi:hypothetical protein
MISCHIFGAGVSGTSDRLFLPHGPRLNAWAADFPSWDREIRVSKRTHKLKLRLITTRTSLLLDNVNENSCLLYRPDITTTIPYHFSATPDAHEVVATEDFAFLENLAVCYTLSSDFLPVLIVTTCRSSFRNIRSVSVSKQSAGSHSKLVSNARFQIIR